MINKRQKRHYMAAAAFGICLVMILCTLPWLMLTGRYAEVDAPVDIAVTPEGEYRIIDRGGRRILLVSQDLKLHKEIQLQEDAQQIVVTDAGETYVRCLVQVNQNESIEKEAVYLLNEVTGGRETVYEKEYETPRLRNEICQISGLGANLRITLRDASGFGIYELAASGSPKELFYLPYPDADLWIHSAVLSQDGRKVYYCLQNGTILCDSLDEGTTEAVYSSTVAGGRESVPKELSPGSGERIYFTDLGFRDIGMIDGKEISWMWEKSSLDQADFLEQEIFEAVNGERALTGCSRYSAYVIREGKPVALTTLELSITAMAASMISKIALGIICVLALYYLLYFVRIFFQRSKLLARVIFVLCLAVGIMGVLFVHTALPKYKALMLTELENRIGDVGYLVAQRIPSDHLLALDSVKDYRNEDYLAVKERVDEMFFSGNGLSDFYCVIYTVREDVITVNYCSKDNCGARYPYDWRFEGSDEQEIMETGRGKIFTNRSSFEGSYSFSLSPIFGEEGEVVGLAEVGVNARQFEEDVNRLTADLMISILVITVVTVLLIIQIFRLSQNKGKEEDE